MARVKTISYELEDGGIAELRRPTIAWRRKVTSQWGEGVDEETKGEGLIDEVLELIECVRYGEDVIMPPYDEYLSDADIMHLCRSIFPNVGTL